MLKNVWLVIGSSRLAREAVAAAKRDWEITATITTNRGILIEPRPNYYFICDEAQRARWCGPMGLAKARGTVTVCVDRPYLEWSKNAFDVVVPDGEPFEQFNLSGPWCMEFAVRNGADAVLLAGLDGYAADPSVDDYFDAPGHRSRGTDWTNDVIAPLCARLCEKYPDVVWIQYGAPEYTIEAKRWSVVKL